MKRLAMGLLFGVMGCVSGASAVTPRALLEVVDFGPPVLSPDGRWVAYRTERASVERNTYDTVWYVQWVEGEGLERPRRLAEGGVPLRDIAGVSLSMAPVWSPDGRWIYYRALVDGRIDVWRAAVDGAGADALTHDAADVRAFRLSEDGQTLEYSVGASRQEVEAAEQAEEARGVHVDPAVPLGQGLIRSARVDGVPATQRFATGTLVRGRLLAQTPDHWKVLHLDTGARGEGAAARPAAEGAAQEGPWRQARSDDGWLAALNRIGTQGDLLQKPDVTLSVRRPDGRVIACTVPLCVGRQFTALQWRPGRREVVTTVTDPENGRAQSILLWEVATQQVRLLAQGPGLINGGRAQDSPCGISAAWLVCVTADANQPPRLERIALDTGARTVLFEPNLALAQELSRGPAARLIHWRGSDGQAFTGQFYPPAGAAAAPLVVNYYQCTGFVRGGVGDEWPFFSLAARGIAALCINQAPYVRTADRRYDAAISAVAGAVKTLSADGAIDCGKVGMGGLSFGSEVTLWTAFNTHLLSAASVSTPSLSSTYALLMGFAGKPLDDMLRLNWQVGTRQETLGRWRQLAPQFHVQRISAPVLFQMSEQEYLFAMDYAAPMLTEGRADMYVFPDEPHQKFQPRHKLAVYQRNVDWFRFWLQGDVDPDPGKAVQYARWREMRARHAAIAPAGAATCRRGVATR